MLNQITHMQQSEKQDAIEWFLACKSQGRFQEVTEENIKSLTVFELAQALQRHYPGGLAEFFRSIA
jgi:hypothetical protein